jgi:hypothetical protein
MPGQRSVTKKPTTNPGAARKGTSPLDVGLVTTPLTATSGSRHPVWPQRLTGGFETHYLAALRAVGLAGLQMLWRRDSDEKQGLVTCGNAVLGGSTPLRLTDRGSSRRAPHVLYMARSTGQNGTHPMTRRILTGRVGLLLLAGCTTGATVTPGPWPLATTTKTDGPAMWASKKIVGEDRADLGKDGVLTASDGRNCQHDYRRVPEGRHDHVPQL